MALRDVILRVLGGVPAEQARIAPRFEGTSMVIGTIDDPQIAEFLRGGYVSGSGAVVTPQTAMKLAVAQRCVRIICGIVASLPTDLMRRQGELARVPEAGDPF